MLPLGPASADSVEAVPPDWIVPPCVVALPLAEPAPAVPVIEDVVGIHYLESNAELAEESLEAATEHADEGYVAPAGETH